MTVLKVGTGDDIYLKIFTRIPIYQNLVRFRKNFDEWGRRKMVVMGLYYVMIVLTLTLPMKNSFILILCGQL